MPIAEHPNGYRYSRFCARYRTWEARQPVALRQTQAAGETLFVDHADGKHATITERVPSSHWRYGDWAIARMNQEAARRDPSVAALCTLILEPRPHPEQGSRACIGILHLARALRLGTRTYGTVKSILDRRTLGAFNPLILNDFSLAPFDPATRHDLLAIVKERYGCGFRRIRPVIPILIRPPFRRLFAWVFRDLFARVAVSVAPDFVALLFS